MCPFFRRSFALAESGDCSSRTTSDCNGSISSWRFEGLPLFLLEKEGGSSSGVGLVGGVENASTSGDTIDGMVYELFVDVRKIGQEVGRLSESKVFLQ